MKRKGFTLIELLVVIAIIAMLLAILMPALNKVKKIAQRVVCGTNLKGLGTAQSVYSNDNEDQFVRQGPPPGNNLNWSLTTPKFDIKTKDWVANPTLSVGASLYLLVREADVSPKSFICGASGQTAYDGKNAATPIADLTALWDFGGVSTSGVLIAGPQASVSYGYHNPYGSNPANGASSSSFAIMADKNPWFDQKLKEAAGGSSTIDTYASNVQRMSTYYVTGSAFERWTIQVANAFAHGREGQNVAFGDGHSEYCKTPDVGMKHDNIYTRKNYVIADESSIRCGLGAVGSYKAPLPGANLPGFNVEATYAAMHAADKDDSLLLNDDDNQP